MPTPSWVRTLWEKPWLWTVLVVVFFCVPLFLGLGRTDLENDEAIYSFAVETMMKDGEWLTPKIIPSETTAFQEKPPLKLWVTYVPMRLGLVQPGEAGLRFMDAILSSLAFLYIFGIGRRLAGPVCGLVAVLLLFSHNVLLYQHGLRSNNMEAAMVLSYAAGVYHFLAWRSLNPDVKRHIFAMAFWFAVGFMTKFVAALFLPVVLGLAALVKREDRGRLYRDWPAFAIAALFAVALIAPWFVYAYAQDPRLFDVMFGSHVMTRFTAYLDPVHLLPWHYYVTRFWAEIADEGTRWIVAVSGPLFLLTVWRRRWIEGLVVVLWFAVPMVAMSAVTSKQYHYAYPYLAPIALAGGWLAAALARRLYRWTATPFDALIRARDRAFPRFLSATKMQMALTIAGLAALIAALATAAFDRISLSLGSASLRNSSVARPLAAAAVAWVIGAPSQILRGVFIAILLAMALPIAAYRANVTEADRPRLTGRKTHDCIAPIVAQQIASGQKPGGAFVGPMPPNWLRFYYLRDLGPFNEGPDDSTPAMLARLYSPTAPQLVIVTPKRYSDFLSDLNTNRARVFARAAATLGIDEAALTAIVDERTIGVVPFVENTLILPAPYSTCGTDIFRLGAGQPQPR